MTQTNTPTLTAASHSATANASRITFGREAAPRRWWRALDRMTLETMNPPMPAHVRAALHDKDVEFTATADSTATTDFAAAVRAAAPGRGEQTTGPDHRSNTEFAAAIRASAPGRHSQG